MSTKIGKGSSNAHSFEQEKKRSLNNTSNVDIPEEAKEEDEDFDPVTHVKEKIKEAQEQAEKAF